MPRSAITRTAFGCSGLGWLPALRASTVPAGAVLDERLGDLGAGAVAGAQEQQPRSAPARLDGVAVAPARATSPGWSEPPGVAEQVAAAEQIGPVVDVAAVGRAAAGGDDAGVVGARPGGTRPGSAACRRAARARRPGDRCDRARRRAASAADRRPRRISGGRSSSPTRQAYIKSDRCIKPINGIVDAGRRTAGPGRSRPSRRG